MSNARYARIRQLGNIEPVHYKSYESLLTPHNNIVHRGYVYTAEGSVSYGDTQPAEWPETLGDRELYFYLPYSGYSDYSGSTVEKSNNDCFQEEYGEEEWVHPVYGGHTTLIGLTGLLNCPEDTFEEVIGILEGLEDYPLIDEEHHSQLENELVNEAWDNWGEHDFTREVENRFPEYTFIWPTDSSLYPVFTDMAERANEYWECENSSPNMWININRVADSVTLDDIDDYLVKYTVYYNDIGNHKDTFYTEEEAKMRCADCGIGAYYSESKIIDSA